MLVSLLVSDQYVSLIPAFNRYLGMIGKKYTTEKLTDLAIRKAKPTEKDYWLDDGGSLRLLVRRTGTKCWRYNYRYEGKQKTLAIGTYPDVPLTKARKSRTDAKDLLSNNIDPSQLKQELKRKPTHLDENTFQVIAKEWWLQKREGWTETHANRIWKRLSDASFKDIGHKNITDIDLQEVIVIAKRIEKRDAIDVAGRVLNDIRRVCSYAIQTGRLTHNPAGELTGILKVKKVSHRASLPREELPQFLKDLEAYPEQGRLLTQLAIKLLLLTFVRQGELRGARWDEFDFSEKLWRIPAQRMKMKADHIVPLSTQMLEVIEQIKPLTGHYELLFPSEKNIKQPMSDNTMRQAIFRMGYDGKTKGKSKAVPHGFRNTASSILNEKGFNPDAIERQLSHKERNGVRAAYTHHARYLDERREMMQWWGDYLGKHI